MGFRMTIGAATAFALLLTTGSAAVAADNAAARGSAGSTDMCERYRSYVTEYTKKTTQGSKVWIPSSRSAGPFQFGGSQSISTADGQLNATTKGSADTVGGSGGVNIGVVQASATYDHQWSRSTTKTTSFTQTFTTNSPTMPRSVNWRWRLYVQGYRFVVLKKCRVPTPLVDAGTYYVRKVVVVPRTRKLYTFSVERFSQRGWLLNMSGEPIRP